MPRMRFAVFAIFLGFCAAAEIASADDAANAWKALRAGGHVALMRHADAPGGFGDPPGFRVDDCATQRNLSAKGRADAERIGARLKSEGIAFEKILSSPWCRCIDTATLLKLGPVETEATFGNVVVLRDQRELAHRGRPRADRQMVRARKPAGRNARCEHSSANGHLAGQRRDRRGARRKRQHRTCRSSEAGRTVTGRSVPQAVHASQLARFRPRVFRAQRKRSDVICFTSEYFDRCRSFEHVKKQMRNAEIAFALPDGQISPKVCPALRAKIFRLTRRANQRLNCRHPVPRRGASAIVTNVGTGCGGRGRHD